MPLLSAIVAASPPETSVIFEGKNYTLTPGELEENYASVVPFIGLTSASYAAVVMLNLVLLLRDGCRSTSAFQLLVLLQSLMRALAFTIGFDPTILSRLGALSALLQDIPGIVFASMCTLLLYNWAGEYYASYRNSSFMGDVWLPFVFLLNVSAYAGVILVISLMPEGPGRQIGESMLFILLFGILSVMLVLYGYRHYDLLTHRYYLLTSPYFNSRSPRGAAHRSSCRRATVSLTTVWFLSFLARVVFLAYSSIHIGRDLNFTSRLPTPAATSFSRLVFLYYLVVEVIPSVFCLLLARPAFRRLLVDRGLGHSELDSSLSPLGREKSPSDLVPSVLDGDLSVDVEKPLGRSLNSVVFAGVYCGVPVAVKELLPGKLAPDAAAAGGHGDVRVPIVMMEDDRKAPLLGDAAVEDELDLESDLREQRSIISRLPQHPNVVRYFGVVAQPPRVIMELMDCSLSKLVKDGSRAIYPDLFFPIALQIVRGLRVLHEVGVVHRDLKPSNILCSHDFSVIKLADLGTADCDPDSSYVTGTAAYMAPEQLSARGEAGSAVDIYAFGVLLWELLTRETPYSQLGPLKLLQLKYRDELPELRFPATVQRGLRMLISQCLNGDPASRPSLELIRSGLLAVQAEVVASRASMDAEEKRGEVV